MQRHEYFIQKFVFNDFDTFIIPQFITPGNKMKCKINFETKLPK